ncbi:hypothetical protein PHISCL_03924 [Aspergillus sclerotialis]|uniref:Large ribosomal subunit protein mL67 n=1 Tax=Aspergillus sclerotialis TaxID=2070753 RepID=A0A3A3A304_9EURO|nr:hypothetical protein PHISCL_03924 [Aspergillus sclerotialis]
MATTKTIPQIVLDPTKIGTWNLVRKPPIDRNTVIQGRVRNPASNAFKDYQIKEGIRLRKALQYLTHGRDIFVYHNIRTNQVVYSLTRYLQKNNVLKQLIYHGKKTVPATLRKDMWVPYYSVHFNDARVGLRAFHLLREFSIQRQLAPPRYMITITEEFLARKRPSDGKKAEEFDKKMEGKVGKLMEPKDRRKAVMNQKATSVADIAAVLKIQEQEFRANQPGGEVSEEAKEDDGLITEGLESEGKEAGEAKEKEEGEADQGEAKEEGEPKKKEKVITKAYLRRQEIAKKKEEIRAQKVAERIESLEKALSWHKGEVKVKVPENVPDGQVRILWMDLQDSQYAESWPESVSHGELQMTRDHVMPGMKNYGEDVIAMDNFAEKEEAQL